MPDFDPTFLASLLLCIAAMLWIADLAKRLFFPGKTPQPFTVAFESRFVSHDEHKEHAADVKEKLSTAAFSRKRMHEDIESLNTRTARLEEQSKSQTDTIQLLSADSREFFKEQRGINHEVLKRLPK